MMKSNLKSVSSRILCFNLRLGLLILIFIFISQCRINIIGDIPDQDNDGILDEDDLCPTGREFDSRIASNDRDEDGCFDDGYEDLCPDYAVDNINIDGDARCDNDARDLCSGNDGGTVFTDTSLDYDNDGCEDTSEDLCPDYAVDNINSDGDIRCDNDLRDLCPGDDGGTVFTDTSVDADSDGCEDTIEDLCPDYAIDNTNIDGDTICDSDARDLCPGDDGGTIFTATSVDDDGDGCEDGAGNEDKCGGVDGNAVSNEDGDSDGLCGQYNETSNPDGDNCPLLSNPSQEDYDGDDLGDVCDGNLDNDHANEGSGDIDLCKSSPLNYLATDDVDNDGCRDSDEDLCLNYSVDNINPDMDDICDSDARDLCPGTGSGTTFTATSVDADNDGCEDGAGNEDKCDGVSGNAVSNEDGDSDGLCGQYNETSNPGGDNCPLLSNPSQEDYDGDDLGDVCDGNPDNDHADESLGATDLCKSSPLNYLATDDVDNDGCKDTLTIVGGMIEAEEDLCLNYSVDNTNSDMDGICDSDARDLCPGTGGGTSFTATSVDADNDGCEDGAGNEDKCGGVDGNAVSNEDSDSDGLCGQLSLNNLKGDSCPSKANNSDNDHSDTDGDYYGNACDVDDDGDGLIEIDNDDTTANLGGSITNMYRDNDGTHYDDGSTSIDTGCGGGVDDDGNDITACNGYELIEDVTIDSSWNTTTPGPSHTAASQFSATFEGNGNSIIITDDIISTISYVGLFGYVSGVLKNFTLRSEAGSVYSFSISRTAGSRRMGTVVGVLFGKSDTERAMIDRVYVVDVNVLDSMTNNTITSKYNRIGGLAGYLDKYATIKNSYTNANIMFSTSGTASYRAGGLVGDIKSYVSIDNSYATGNITVANTVSLTGTNYFGGLIGSFSSEILNVSDIFVSNCYATGNITTTTNLTNAADEVYLGALIAHSNDDGNVRYSYATGSITDTANSVGTRFGGQLISVEGLTATNNYYNVESAFPDTTIVALVGAHSGMYGYTDTELKTPIAPDYTFVGVPSTATDTEIGCIARNGTWTTSPDTCTGETASGSYTLYTDWSTDNWDFGDPTQLPALKFTDDSTNLIPDQR